MGRASLNLKYEPKVRLFVKIKLNDKTAPYKLAKFLVPILAPFTSNKYTVDNSYSFVRQITSVPNADNYFMASFDVENLFTNIPLAETIDICIQSLFTDSNSTALGMDRNQFRTFLQKSVLNSFFMFNDKLFKQIEGLGMGLPLGPSFANIFMSYYEQQWLDDCPVDFKPAFYRRYVDDTFLLFHHRDHAEKFLTYLNEKHSNIKFTMESNNKILCLFWMYWFADVTIVSGLLCTEKNLLLE